MGSKISDSQNFTNIVGSSSFISETDETDKNESNFKLNRRFTIVKTPQDDLPAINIITHENHKSDCNDNNEDVFDESSSSSNKLNKRENEGQDTITSMTYKPFLRNFERVRRSSTKSNNACLEHDESSNATDCLNTQKDNINSLSGSNYSFQSGVRSLFRKRNSNTSLEPEEKRNNLLDFIKSDANLVPCDQVTVLDDDVIDVKIINSNKMLVPNDEVVQSKSDQVFEVLKQAIDKNDGDFLDKDFIEQVIQTVKFQQLKTKQHRENVKRLCRILELLVFFIITSMTIFLVINVFGQLKLIYKISEETTKAEIAHANPKNDYFSSKRVVFNDSLSGSLF